MNKRYKNSIALSLSAVLLLGNCLFGSLPVHATETNDTLSDDIGVYTSAEIAPPAEEIADVSAPDLIPEVITQPNTEMNTIMQANPPYKNALKINPNQYYTDSLKSYGTQNWYKIETETDGYISLSFAHEYVDSYSDYWKAYIYDSTVENKLGSYSYQGNYYIDHEVEESHIGVSAGSYYIEITSDYFPNVNYQFKINFTSSNVWEKEFNDIYPNANEIPLNTDIHGSIRDYFDKDWYKITTNADGYISLNFLHAYVDNSSRYWKATIYDSTAENKLDSYEYNGKDTIEILGTNIGVPAGSYYILITYVSFSNIDYQFKINFTPSNVWEKEFNETYPTATEIALNTDIYGSVMDYFDRDWYKITTATQDTLTLCFSHGFVDSSSDFWGASVYDYTGTKKLISYSYKGNDTTVNKNQIKLSAGTYYILISAVSLSTLDYHFKVATGDPTANSSINMTLSRNMYTYTGNYIQPPVSLSFGGQTLVEGTDYVLSYSNNLAIGTGTVTAKCMGSYTGTVSKTFTIVPAATTITSAAPTSYSSIKINWTKVPGVTGYEIYRSEDGEVYRKAATIKKSSAKSYTFSKLSVGKTYSFRIVSYKMVGKKKYSGFSSNVVSARPAVAKVKNIKAVPTGYNKIKLSWSKVAGASGYAIFRSTDGADGNYTQIIILTQGGARSYTDENVLTGLDTGVTYYYKIYAFRNANSISWPGEYSDVVHACPALGKAAISSISNKSAGQVKLVLNRVSGAQGYEIYRSAYRQNLTQTNNLVDDYDLSMLPSSAKKVTYRDFGSASGALTIGSRYYYLVRPYRFVNGSKVYGKDSAIKQIVIKK